MITITRETASNILDHLDKIKDRLNAEDQIRNDIWRNNIVGWLNNNNQHPTEEKYPQMTTRFQEITDEMYKVFLEKNNDYSKWNILGTGIVGLATRFWDKTSRVMNLTGFDIGTGEYTAPKKNMVEDENIEKTFLDASNYGIIARIYLEGKWGR